VPPRTTLALVALPPPLSLTRTRTSRPPQYIERSFPSVAASNTLKEAIVSVTTLGASFGAFSGGFFSGAHELVSSGIRLRLLAYSLATCSSLDQADFYGRRSAIILSDTVFIAAALKMGVAMTPKDLIKGRALMGVAIGLASIVGPVYIAESAPNSIRATMVVMYAIQIGIGTSLAYIVDFGFTHTQLSWRLMLSVAAFPAILQMIAMFNLPESPRWLAHYGRIGEAKQIMAGLTLDPNDMQSDAAELDNVYARAQKAKRDEQAPKSDEQSATPKTYRQRDLVIQLCLGIGLFLMNNFSGECALVYYSIEIIGMAGVVSEDAIAQQIINIGMCATTGVLIGLCLIDRVGRRKLIAISGTGTCCSLFLLAASFAIAGSRSPDVLPPDSSTLSETCVLPVATCAQCLQSMCVFCGSPYLGPGEPSPGYCLSRADDAVDAKQLCSSMSGASNGTEVLDLYREGCPSGYGWLSLLALCSFQFWFQIGLGIVPSAVNAEFYPNSIRGLCNGSAVAISWLGNFCVSSTFLSLAATLGAPRTFCINACMVGTGTIIMLFFLPETCGLSFGEIQNLFKLYQTPGAPPPWELHAHILAQRDGDGAPPEEEEEAAASIRI